MISVGEAIAAMTFVTSTSLWQWYKARRALAKANKRIECLEEQQGEPKSESLPGSGPFRTNVFAPHEFPPRLESSKRLYPYAPGSNKTIHVCCPMCGGMGLPKACQCSDHAEPHLHQKCDNGGCGFRYAMQSRIASEREKAEREKAQKK